MSGLSNRIVIAGPNGVGKTRLLDAIIQELMNPQFTGNRVRVAATCEEEVSTWQNRRELDLGVAPDYGFLQQTLQQQRSRKSFQSSLIKFESNRTVQRLTALPFQFEFPDPDAEQISWDSGLQTMESRFQDVIHTIVKKLARQDQGIANRARQLKREGKDSMGLEFEDLLESFRRAFSALIPGKRMVDISKQEQTLTYEEDGETRPFDTLSSGEREVVIVTFDFLLRQPRDCIVFFDEPELHLHPELSARFLRTLQNVGRNNQFVLSTHSPDVISASLQDTVVFLAPPNHGGLPEDQNQAIVVGEDDPTNLALRALGQSLGVIALGKRIVLIEGTNASVDKLTYEALAGNLGLDLVFAPSGSRTVGINFTELFEDVLSKNLWGVEFFVLSDGDGQIGQTEGAEQWRRLPRYHIENYYLDEKVWARVLLQLEGSESSRSNSDHIRAMLRDIAKGHLARAVGLRVTSDLAQRVGRISILPKNSHDKNADELVALFDAQLVAERTRLAGELDMDTVEKLIRAEHDRISKAIADDTEEWKKLIPGRPIVNSFAGAIGLKQGHALRLYLEQAELGSETSPFAEIEEILSGFANSSS